ncbi:MAG: GDSL-type esterase/lipase family protein [Candidatus Didemnitutus sp.]|nr:GDSL-type esterase/lipase family protein [Candidatus Didemnitutus sp.]
MKRHRSAPLALLLALGLAGCATGHAQPAAPVAPVATTPPIAAPVPPPRTPESAVTPNNRNPRRHAEFLARIQHGPVGVLFLGDSITDFWPRKGELTWLKFAPYQPANFGISAERTEDVLWRLQNGELDGIDPKVVVMMIGTNNLGHFADERPEWAAAGVQRLLETIRAKLPRATILLYAVFPRATAGSALRTRVAELNRHLAPLADGRDIRFIDIGAGFLDAQGEIPADIMPDKLHPGHQGYDVWYADLAPRLAELMR